MNNKETSPHSLLAHEIVSHDKTTSLFPLLSLFHLSIFLKTRIKLMSSTLMDSDHISIG